MAQDTMKGTMAFQDTIAQYLMQRAQTEPDFAVKLATPTKSMEECCTYIINQVRKSGCCGFADDDIYNMALHYWDEPEVEVGDPVNCNVVVNHVVELTDEEKAEARQRAINQLCEEEKAKMRKASQPKASTNPQVKEASLFDF